MKRTDHRPGQVTHTDIVTNGVRLHVALAGPPQGQPVFLLHGFPECWYGWRHQIVPLAEAGYRVVVPDQRGYNTSDKPPRLGDYTRDVLAADVVGLMDHFGVERGLVVGHDWGGAVAWWLACQRPERVARLAVLNLPHPIVFARALRTPRQLLRSWYMLWFQVPWLPEAILGRRGAAPLLDVLQRSTRPGAVSDEDLRVYRDAFMQPGALSAMLRWYRAAFFRPGARLAHPRLEMPCCLIWGKKDEVLGWEMAAPSMERCADGRLFFLEDAGHFVQLDEPRRVAELLLDFFGAPAGVDHRP